MNRNLDGIYFRVQRDGKWQNICFSDLTEDEMDEVLTGKQNMYLCELCKRLAKALKDIGEEFDITGFIK